MSGLARPRTYAPKGTSLGIVGFLITSVAIPPTLASIAAPYLPHGTDWFGLSLFAGAALSMLLFLPLVAALYSRKYWGICYFFTAGCLLIVCYFAVVVAALACKLGLVPPGDPEQALASTTGMVFLLVTLPAPLLLARALSLRYWQPWTAAATWEPGDERAPAWAAAVTGIGIGNVSRANAVPPVKPQPRRPRAK